MANNKRLRELREDHDYTQKCVADYPGMKQPQYFRYEQGYRDIPTDILIKLADLYHTSTDYLLERTASPEFTAKQQLPLRETGCPEAQRGSVYATGVNRQKNTPICWNNICW